MATFNCHQDSEKENTVHLNSEKGRNVQGAKDKRSTFAVLNNVPHRARGQQGKPVSFRDLKNKVKNNCTAAAACGGDKNVKKASTTNSNSNSNSSTNNHNIVPVEQFKSFSVYEDQPSTSTASSSSSSSAAAAAVVGKKISKEKENIIKDKDNVACANISTCAIRDPLKVLSHDDKDAFESPVSVGGEVSSPMSIDKIDENPSACMVQLNQQPPPRNDRERFFEVTEYQKDILEYFRDVEKKNRPKPTYMNKQPDINYSMRTILVDWLVEVAEEYRLHNETLYLAVSYIDRFLSVMSVVRAKLQLVGTAAMFIAAKYEEIYPPDVAEFVFITDDTYTKAQVLKMEQIILRTLHFDLSVPTNLVFINTYAVLYEMPDQVKFLATYIAELSLLSGDPYLHFLPSQISSGSLALARYILGFPIWCPELETITLYSLRELKDIILLLCRTHNLSLSLVQQAIQEKYRASKYMEVSTIKPIQINEEKFISILSEYNKSLEISNIENTLTATTTTTTETEDQTATAATNEKVRKMISSLMFL